MKLPAESIVIFLQAATTGKPQELRLAQRWFRVTVLDEKEDHHTEKNMKDVSPQEAHDLMESDPDYIYLDVRSIPEFDAGHPPKAINIPLLHFAPGAGMTPNPDFVAVVEANVAKDAKLLVGCKSGGRSAQACQILGQMGYSDATNVRGGFVGAADNMGRVVEPGWSMLNLPVSTDLDEDSSYESLAAKAGK